MPHEAGLRPSLSSLGLGVERMQPPEDVSFNRGSVRLRGWNVVSTRLAPAGVIVPKVFCARGAKPALSPQRAPPQSLTRTASMCGVDFTKIIRGVDLIF